MKIIWDPTELRFPKPIREAGGTIWSSQPPALNKRAVPIQGFFGHDFSFFLFLNTLPMSAAHQGINTNPGEVDVPR